MYDTDFSPPLLPWKGPKYVLRSFCIGSFLESGKSSLEALAYLLLNIVSVHTSHVCCGGCTAAVFCVCLGGAPSFTSDLNPPGIVGPCVVVPLSMTTYVHFDWPVLAQPIHSVVVLLSKHRRTTHTHSTQTHTGGCPPAQGPGVRGARSVPGAHGGPAVQDQDRGGLRAGAARGHGQLLSWRRHRGIRVSRLHIVHTNSPVSSFFSRGQVSVRSVWHR